MLYRRFSQRFLTLKRNENPGPQELAQFPRLAAKKSSANLRRNKKQKTKSLSDNRKNPNPKT